jgi:hypothetical protein
MGPSGSAAPVDPYNGPVTSPAQTQGPVTAPDTTPPAKAPDTGAPAPSQQQAPAKAPEPDTQQATPKGQEPGTPPPESPQPPASEGKPNPVIDKPAPTPIDTPAPTKDSQSSREAPGSAAKADPSNAPGVVEPNGPDAPSNTAAAPGNSAPGSGVAASSAAGPADTAAAEPAKPTGPVVDVENAPPACRDAGKLATSRDRGAALSAKISFAICTANAALATLQLVDAEASVQEVDRATSNSIGLLDEVAAAGDPKWAIVALHATGDLLATMTKRMIDSVPANQPAELRDMRTQMLQPHLQPWIERTQKAFAEVDRLAKANPQVAKSQVVATAVADSRKRMSAGVATR